MKKQAVLYRMAVRRQNKTYGLINQKM